MFEKIGRSAERLASAVSVSRRGFFGQFARLASGVAAGAIVLATPTASAQVLSRCNQPCCGCFCSDAICRLDYRYICHRAC